MICFEVIMNGQKLCVAGVGEEGVLSTIISWAYHQNRQNSDSEGDENAHIPRLHIGGIANGEKISYVESPFYVKVGDEVSIRIIDSETYDNPLKRKPVETPEERKEQRRKQYEKLKKEFEGEN